VDEHSEPLQMDGFACLRDSEAHYRLLFEDSPVAMWEEDHSAVKAYIDELLASGVTDIAGFLGRDLEAYEHCVRLARVLNVNRAAAELYDAASVQELVERADEVDLQTETREIRRFWAALAEGRTSATYEDTARSLTGRRLVSRETCMVAPGHEETWDLVYIVEVDVTRRAQAEAALVHANRLLTVSSQINQMMVSQTSTEGLLSEACRIFVESGGFAGAWIGLIAHDEGRIVPVAVAGGSLDEVEALGVRFDDSPAGRGPTGRAVRSGRPVICEDLQADATTAPWHEAARAHGLRSAARVPLRRNGEVIGVLDVYATERGAIAQDDVGLLEELAGDLAFSLKALEHAAAREAAEAALRRSQERYRRIIMTAAEGLVVLDAERRILLVNDEFCRLLGYSAEELMGASPDLYLFPSELPVHLERWQDRRAGEPGRRELRLRRKDGSPRWVLASTQPIIDEGERFAGVLAMFTDIHERRRADEHARRTLQRLRLSIEAAVKTLARTVEIRDPYTAGHQERVAELAVAIGRRLELRSRTMTSLRIGALIHDIGKIGIPAEILSKPTALNALEWNLIIEHPQRGYEVLREMRFPGPVATIVRQHHERLDGSGYPQGLSGGKINICARIIAVADVVEAMSSHRPYRPARGIEAALAEIEAGRGGLFDPRAVDACLALFREEGFAFSASGSHELLR